VPTTVVGAGPRGGVNHGLPSSCRKDTLHSWQSYAAWVAMLVSQLMSGLFWELYAQTRFLPCTQLCSLWKMQLSRTIVAFNSVRETGDA
jgi:hypothetical protein